MPEKLNGGEFSIVSKSEGSKAFGRKAPNMSRKTEAPNSPSWFKLPEVTKVPDSQARDPRGSRNPMIVSGFESPWRPDTSEML